MNSHKTYQNRYPKILRIQELKEELCAMVGDNLFIIAGRGPT